MKFTNETATLNIGDKYILLDAKCTADKPREIHRVTICGIYTLWIEEICDLYYLHIESSLYGVQRNIWFACDNKNMAIEAFNAVYKAMEGCND